MKNNTSTKFTFDQGFIQNDATGDFLYHLETTARCRAFTGDKIREHKIIISADKTVWAWDSTAEHFTTCHRLSRATQRRIIGENVK